MTIIELFSGIGSQAKALQNLGIDIEVIGTCEWDIHALTAYDAIHCSSELLPEIAAMSKEEVLNELNRYKLSNNGKEPMDYKTLKTYSSTVLQRILTAIKRCKNYVDINSLKGKDIPYRTTIDLLTYSFPCQDLSNVGAFHGYNKGIDKDSGSRSSLLWQVGRILKEMKESNRRMPRYLLMENVPALLAQRHITNFRRWIDDLDELGYISRYYELNAHNFGLPQNRPRLLMISVFVGKSQTKRNKLSRYFENVDKNSIVRDFRESEYYRNLEMGDLLRTDYSNEVILAEARECNPNDTVSRRKIWEENPQLVLKGNIINHNYDMIRTITTKQDRNPNSGNLYFDMGGKGKSLFRYLTPRECFLFMGFTDEDYNNLISNNPETHKGSVLFPRDKIIRLAGNSIPVKLLEGIFYQIIQIEEQVINHNGRT